MIIKDPKFKKKIVLIDYKVGNHLSIMNTLSLLKYKYIVSNNQSDIEKADCYILPGVGSFSEAMKNINKLGIVDTLRKEVLINKKPLLGICLGMQILADSSKENGFHHGLGFISGKVEKIKEKTNLKIPHVGWNNLKILKKTPLFENLNAEPNFYFDHSYHFVCNREFVSSISSYGCDITASIQKENIFGVQFHPEKSQTNGFKLYRSFFNYVTKNE